MRTQVIEKMTARHADTPLTILLVEDDPVIAMAEQVMLEENGFRVILASNGPDAVSLAANPDIELVLMDIDLGPGMDGTDAARIILRTRDIPVVFLSSHTEPAIVDRTETITSYGYVVKNSGETVLIASLRMALKLHEAHQRIKQNNEEIAAANEELQATIEELEATNEEVLQSHEKLMMRDRDLAESERNYRLLFENMLNGFAYHETIYDERGKPVDYRYLNVNPAFERLTGLHAADIVGRTVKEVIPNIENYWIETYGRVATSGESFSYQNFTQDLGRHYDVWAFSPEKGRFATIFSDITEQVISENKLKSLVERNEYLRNYSPDAVILFEKSGRIIMASIRACELFGYSRTEMQSLALRDLVEPPLGERLEAFIRDMAVGKSRESQWNMHGKDGTRFEIEMIAVTLPDGIGQAVLRNVTRRNRAERELSDMKVLLQSAFEQTPVPMVLVSAPDGVIRLYNSACKEILGITEEPSAVGRLLAEFHQTWQDFDVDGNPVRFMDLPLARALRGESVTNLENRVVRKDGTERWELVNGAPIYNEAGNLIAGFVAFPDITEIKELEKSLIASEMIYRTLVDNLNAGLIITTIDGDIIHANDMLARMAGYESMEEFLATKAWNIYADPWDRERLVEELFSNGSVRNKEIRSAKKDGSLYWVSMNLILQNDEHGAPSRILGLLDDITERKRNEEELLASEARYRFLTENAFDMISRHAPDATVLYVTPSSERLLGYRPDELIGSTVDRAMLPDGIETAWQAINGAIAAGQDHYRVTHRMIRKDGAVIWAETEGRIIYDDGGSVQEIHCVVRDITERKIAEQTLQEKRDELERFFLASLDLLCIANTDGRFLRLNPEWGKVLGYDLAELEGKKFLDFVHPEDLAATMTAVERLADQKEVIDFVNRYRASDGSYRWIEWRSYPAGELIYAAARDITMRMQTERFLEEALRDRENLLHELQHRVKNSFSMIVGLIDLEKNRIAEGPTRDALQSIRDRVSSLAELYTMLYQKGKAQEIKLDFYISQIVHSLASSYVVDGKKIRILQRCDEISMDAKSSAPFGLIVNELVTNALKYAFPDGRAGTIHVDLKRTSGGIELSVTDDGVGMPGGYDIDRSSGLGMMIIKMLSKQLGGSVAFDTRNGTSFVVTVPIKI